MVLGSPALFSNTDMFLEMKASYAGCIRHLEINNKAYHLKRDALEGFDVRECRIEEDDCQRLTCQHHGLCRVALEDKSPVEGAKTAKPEAKAYCECPLGFDGQFCETPVDIQIPSFNGESSHLIFPGLGQTSPLWNDVQLVLRPQADNGLILYNGDHHDGDFVAIFLSQGFLEFAFDAGDGVTVVR